MDLRHDPTGIWETLKFYDLCIEALYLAICIPRGILGYICADLFNISKCIIRKPYFSHLPCRFIASFRLTVSPASEDAIAASIRLNNINLSMTSSKLKVSGISLMCLRTFFLSSKRSFLFMP